MTLITRRRCTFYVAESSAEEKIEVGEKNMVCDHCGGQMTRTFSDMTKDIYRCSSCGSVVTEDK